MDTNNSKNVLILPGDSEFNKILATPPPGWKNEKTLNYAITPDSSILKLVTDKELNELYFDAGLYGDGSELDEDEKFYSDDEAEESLLYYPDHLEDYEWQ